MLLAYLQHVSESFTENKLYPPLSELMKHYRNVTALRDNKNNFTTVFRIGFLLPILTTLNSCTKRLLKMTA